MASLSGVVRSFCPVVGLLKSVLVVDDWWFVALMLNDVWWCPFYFMQLLWLLQLLARCHSPMQLKKSFFKEMIFLLSLTSWILLQAIGLWYFLPEFMDSLVFVFWWICMICSPWCCSLNGLSDISNLSIGFHSIHCCIASISSLNHQFCQLSFILTKSSLTTHSLSNVNCTYPFKFLSTYPSYQVYWFGQ